jgi:biopolymer transport protein ExbD
MIDILLVLLIIFMVIVPTVPKGLDALVPQPPKTPQPQTQDQRTIVVQIICPDTSRACPVPKYKINETDVDKRELLPRLTDIYANRAERVMFVRGDDNVDFRYVAEVIDIGKSANVDHIGLMTPRIMAGQ